jgi:hypothetical protein
MVPIYVYKKKTQISPLDLHWMELSVFDLEMAVGLSALRVGKAALYPQEDSWYSFLLEAESIPGSQSGLGQLKSQMTSTEIEPATFLLVA